MSRGHGHGVYLVSGPGPGLLEKGFFAFKIAFCDHKKGGVGKNYYVVFFGEILAITLVF